MIVDSQTQDLKPPVPEYIQEVDYMEISGVSMPSSINTGVEIAILSKALDTAAMTGEVLTEMMGQAPVIPGLGEHIDIRV